MDIADLWAVRDDRTLSEHAKSAYIMLWLRLPNSHPSIPTIAGDMGASEDTARKGIKELKDRGFVEVTHNKNPKGDNATNTYNLFPVRGS